MGLERTWSEAFKPDPELLAILKGDPLRFVMERLDKVIVGEDENKVALFLSKLSYLRQNPTHERVVGVSGIGKTWLVEKVLEAFPPEDVVKVTRVTPAWLDYVKNQLKHKILYVGQMGGAESASGSLQIMMTEKGLMLGTVKRGDSGTYEPYYVQAEGPISLVTTTTSLDVDPQFETRTFTIHCDDSKEQTERVQDLQSFWDAYPWEAEKALEQVREVRRVVSWLRNHGIREVVVPYAKLIKLPSDKVRVRRDRPRLIELIKSLAMLRQMKRLVIERNGVKYVCAEWADAMDAIKIASKILTKTLAELSPLEEKIMAEAKKLGAMGVTWFTAKQLAPLVGKSQNTVRMALNHLVEKGYVFLEEEGRGKGFCNVYSLNEFAEDPSKTLFSRLSVLTDADVKKELKSWVSENIKNVSRYKYDEDGVLTPQ